MKIGFCMLLWTTSLGEEHKSLLEDIKATGYDGVEVPIFAGTPDDYARTGAMLDALDLGRTAISVIPTPDMNILSEDAADRKRGEDYLKWLVDCAAALGAEGIGGPLHQTLGHFSGEGPSEAEFERAREVHRIVGDHAAANGQVIALEAVNRFETYFANTMGDLCAYTRSLNHPAIKTMYDTFHANLEEQDPVDAFARNAGDVVHIHISENDRGVPGRGHVPWAETFKAIKASGYDRWLTIEAFGRGLPELAAATRVWRDFAESPEAYYRDGYDCIRNGWDAA
ncbi:sugar phosphate isomerase/epimerase family protein [Ruegeria arenilitoris]|uniref:sugar phosphate isomerase/epimerase family protein n=1 Tax=Ruegeria arenilitoris TaxID=1173585 RepID=UPI00147ECC4E|nr:sugar phosphate isomerase/epimerase [Ruegeria arenilitoris]